MKLPLKERAINRAAVVTLVALAAISLGSEAQADPGYVNVPRKLPKTQWYNAPQEAQIVDERMRVKNFVQPDEVPEAVRIPLPKTSAAGGSSGPGFKMVGSNLPASGFASQIPVGGLPASRALPQTKMGGLTPAAQPAAARPIGLKQPAAGKAQTAAKTVSATPVAAEYSRTRPSSSNFSFEQSVKTDVRAKLGLGKP